MYIHNDILLGRTEVLTIKASKTQWKLPKFWYLKIIGFPLPMYQDFTSKNPFSQYTKSNDDRNPEICTINLPKDLGKKKEQGGKGRETPSQNRRVTGHKYTGCIHRGFSMFQTRIPGLYAFHSYTITSKHRITMLSWIT